MCFNCSVDPPVRVKVFPNGEFCCFYTFSFSIFMNALEAILSNSNISVMFLFQPLGQLQVIWNGLILPRPLTPSRPVIITSSVMQVSLLFYVATRFRRTHIRTCGFTYASRSLYRSISFKEMKELFPTWTVVTGR